MSTDVNAAVTTWNTECATAKTELEALEATLKADYNKYVDSLAAYVARVKTANDIRSGYITRLSGEDAENNTRKREAFITIVDAPIENNAVKYLLDNELVKFCNVDELLARKSL